VRGEFDDGLVLALGQCQGAVGQCRECLRGFIADLALFSAVARSFPDSRPLAAARRTRGCRVPSARSYSTFKLAICVGAADRYPDVAVVRDAPGNIPGAEDLPILDGQPIARLRFTTSGLRYHGDFPSPVVWRFGEGRHNEELRQQDQECCRMFHPEIHLLKELGNGQPAKSLLRRSGKRLKCE